MKLDVHFIPTEVVRSDLGDRTVVVIDVLRATSTIVEALANGARTVVPAPGVDEAVRLAQGMGREQALLCGERHCVRVDGFDLGNSPREFTAERVAHKSLVMTTTNGTAAVLAASGAREELIASFLNLGAVVEALAAAEGPLAVLCAGRAQRFALEDAVCAGALVRRLRERLDGQIECNDAGTAAEMLARDGVPRLAALLRDTAAGRQLIEAGLGEDIEFCAMLDRHAVVPYVRDRQVTLE